MRITRAGIQRHAVIILALTSFLLLSASEALAQDKSRTVQKGNDHTFSHDLNAVPITFEAVNPKTGVAGRMTVTVTGTVRGSRLSDGQFAVSNRLSAGQSAVGSHLEVAQQASFSFVPYYPYSPSYSATVSRLQAAGDTKDDSIFIDFALHATGSDGSMQWFMLRDVVTATEQGAHIAFKQLPLPDKLVTHPELTCATMRD